jgi:Flp pilus assembly protein TadG
MVEFALCFPFLLLLSVSAIGLGHAEETANDLATVVREGARYASVNSAAYGCTGGASATNCSASTIQGIVQVEADSLNASAGGVTVANSNCLWSGSANPPSLSATPSSPTAPTNATGSCLTIAYYTSDVSGTTACAYYQSATSAFINVNSGTCTATSSTSAPIYVAVTVAITESASGNPIMVTLNGLHITPLFTQSYSMEVVP